MRVALVAVFTLALLGVGRAVEPGTPADISKAKAVLLLSGCKSPNCPTAEKAKLALATSGLAHVPAPREKPVIEPLPTAEPAPPTAQDCRDGTCYPRLAGFTRGPDGVYRQTGVATSRNQR